jgi:hypothetical protein
VSLPKVADSSLRFWSACRCGSIIGRPGTLIQVATDSIEEVDHFRECTFRSSSRREDLGAEFPLPVASESKGVLVFWNGRMFVEFDGKEEA